MMPALALLLAFATAAAATAAEGAQATPPAPVQAQAVAQSRSWNFDRDLVDNQPTGFSFARTGSGLMGAWVVSNQTDAPSRPYVLAQVMADHHDYHFPVAVADDPVPQDLKVGVKCRVVSGDVQQSCGLVFRYTDFMNYYVARASVYQANVRLYSVKDGEMRPVAGSPAKVTLGAWNELRAEVKGDHLVVSFNGAKLIDTHDSTIPTGTKVGVWTEADSVAHFDDLTAVPLP